MKTKFKIVGLLLFLLVLICIKTKVNETQDDILLLNNIEALANNEGGTGGKCILSGSVDCPISHIKVYIVR